jgi:hypothetical protein
MPSRDTDPGDLAVAHASAVRALLAIARGVRAGDAASGGASAALDAASVRDALVAVVLRLAFLAHAEARGLDAPEPAYAPGAPFRVPDDAVREAQDALGLRDAGPRDVEALGSVHEALVAFAVTRTTEPSILAGPEHAPVGLSSPLVLDGAARLERLEGVVDGRALRRARAAIAGASSSAELARAIDPGAEVVPAGALVVVRTDARRRSGSHYTPRALADDVADRALAPLVGPEPTSARLLDLAVCDPAMGSGAFLLAACRWLAGRLEAAWSREGHAVAGDRTRAARRAVAARCLFGVDASPTAALVARLSLWLESGGGAPLSFVDDHLRLGDALLGAPHPDGVSREAAIAAPVARALDWPSAFPDVFDPSRPTGPGFDAMLGNPPWISYAGRAAQPIDPALRRLYAARFASFGGYRNLQGLFVERAVSLLRPGGRLGFVLPSSMSEQDGYAPTRRAHDALAACDASLRDLGEDEFAGVFQPCMVLVSTRLASPRVVTGPATWPVERPDLDAGARRLLAKLARAPLPPELFGERGLQTSGDDVRHLARERDDAHGVALRAGGDVAPFRLAPPSWFADPTRLGARLRAPRDWAAVRVVLRQTARVPMAALSDGLAFRNSVLAGFESAAYPAEFLVAYLNATPIRWLHFARHRDARQGMPQLKIGHLRVTPAPPDARCVKDLAAIGAALSAANDGLSDADQARIDAIVADAFDLDEAERARVAAWWASLRGA